MSAAFNTFLSGSLDGTPILRTYQHATRLFVDNTYARAPKVGFLYFVVLNINPAAKTISSNSLETVGLLAKKIELPKFNPDIEKLNQYNKKVNVLTGMTYSATTIEFHDDNSNLTTDLWRDYYTWHYADGRYSDVQYRNNRYGTDVYSHGLDVETGDSYFTSIDLYVMHLGNFTQYRLMNPVINEWIHDTVGSEDGTKILGSKMNIRSEAVLYNSGAIEPDGESGIFAAKYYDNTPSPIDANNPVTDQYPVSSGVLLRPVASSPRPTYFDTPIERGVVVTQPDRVSNTVGNFSIKGIKTLASSVKALRTTLGNIRL